MSSITTKLAMKAISGGLRLPRTAKFEAAHQHGRTLDEIKRLEINVVLDVGANRGHYARHLRMLGYDGHILSFEPDPGTFRHLQAAAEGDDRWVAVNAALGASEGVMNLNVIQTEDGETTLSSFREHIGDLPTHVVSVAISTVREALRVSRLPADQRVFLKMDTQGFDLEVFAGGEDVDAIALIQSEVSVIPLYKGMPTYLKALETYQAAGFSLLELFVVNRTAEGAVLEYDALLARR
jgi:FkbM family methyltransferase